MSSKYWYFYCPVCEKWLPHTEHVAVPKGYKVKGHIAFAMCKTCRDKIKKLKLKKRYAQQ